MQTLQFPSPYEKILPEDINIAQPSSQSHDKISLNRIKGALVGLAIGDALGTSVEFRPHSYLTKHPVREMLSGGTWGLQIGQWTDDTSMALCLASSLITQKCFNPYDQMVRYKWWYRYGYLSSTGHCFDIGNNTRRSLEEFCRRQNQLKRDLNYTTESEVDQISFQVITKIGFDVNCGASDAAGNGALMRLAPVPLFFYRTPSLAVALSGESARLTHGDEIAIDACRYYGALIIAAIHGEPKENLLSNDFYCHHRKWFGSRDLDERIVRIAAGSYKKARGYQDGIRGKGYVVATLEAALWAFWDTNSFEKGALNAVNLGDDTDTTAAVYGQLAGAYYGFQNIPKSWVDKVYANRLIICVAEWLQYLGFSQNNSSEYEKMNQTVSSTIQSYEPASVYMSQPRQISPTVINKTQHHSHHKRSKSATGRSRFLFRNLLCHHSRANEN